MKPKEPQKAVPRSFFWIGALLVVCVVFLLFFYRSDWSPNVMPTSHKQVSSATASLPRTANIRHHGGHSPVGNESAEVILAKKLALFAKKQRTLFETLAKKHHVAVPDDIKRFFDAAEAGNWEEENALWKSLSNPKYAGSAPSAELAPIWRAVRDTWGATQMAQIMPAQEYLNYGNSVLNSLQPGMVYIGGTDPGYFIPNMMNATSDGEQHVVLTQNALPDSTYLQYLGDLYGDQIKTLTEADQQQAFQTYSQDAMQRLQHDQQFPDEPPQVRPGENISLDNGQLKMSGSVAVMGISEVLLQTFMQSNPDATFGLEESFSLPSTYPGAVPDGPIMQLRSADAQNPVTSDMATQSVNYWSTTTQQLLADPEAANSPATLVTYSHDAAAQGNLLAADNFDAQAEQDYRLASQLTPSNFEAVSGLSSVLYRNGQTDQAFQILNDFAQQNPTQQAAVNAQRNFLTSAKK